MRCYRNAPSKKRGVNTAAWCPDREAAWANNEALEFPQDMNAALRVHFHALSPAIQEMGRGGALESMAN
eukprot:4950400-Pyramimonas_sp.AAC.1